MIKNPKISLIMVATLIFLSTNCRKQIEIATETKAFVTPEQKQKALELVKNIDYLPWSYTLDGCFARATYIAMELAANDIPSSNIFILNEQLNNGWGWHVAPPLKPTSESESLVIDPALIPSGPVSVQEWLSRAGSKAASVSYAILPGSNDRKASADQATNTAPREAIPTKDDYARMTHDFASMKPFKYENVVSDCQLMHQYLVKESHTDVAGRQAKLIAQTKSLIKSLKSKGKLTGEPDNLDQIPCGNPEQAARPQSKPQQTVATAASPKEQRCLDQNRDGRSCEDVGYTNGQSGEPWGPGNGFFICKNSCLS